MRAYRKDAPSLIFATASTKLVVLAAVVLLLSALSRMIYFAVANIPTGFFITVNLVATWKRYITWLSIALCIASAVTMISAFVVYFMTPDCIRIRDMIRRALFCSEYGNPLHLKDGERLPSIKCKATGLGLYEVRIRALSSTVEDMQKVSSSISSALNGKYERFAVTQINSDIAFNHVAFVIEDVLVDKSFTVSTVNDLCPKSPTELIVQQGTYIDLTTSGSMLVAGKTRSGKTTGVISLLMQVLLAGRDNFGSEIMIIDPKRAELSRVPHVIAPDEDGEVTQVLNAILHFADTITNRQKVLNDLSVDCGDAVHWWDAGFHPSILFIDEYVALRSMLPAKASKDAPDYSLAVFDAALRRIVTMGASAGCYVIISIAEASVESGGLPAMLRSAMSTRILFMPTLPEARLLWSSEKLEALNATRRFAKGDAWFSSTDGKNDNPMFVHFPRLKLHEYRVLGRLLQQYYSDRTAPPCEAKGGAVPMPKR